MKNKLSVPIYLLVLIGVLILGGGALSGALVKGAIVKTNLTPVPQLAEEKEGYFSKFISRQYAGKPTFEDYLDQGNARGWWYLALLDQGFIQAQEVLKNQKFSSDQEIKDYLDKADLGVCRHRSVLAFWLLKLKNPQDRIDLVGGDVEGVPNNLIDKYSQLDVAHVWLERDGRVIELMPISPSRYIPYIYIEMGEDKSNLAGLGPYDLGYWQPSIKLNNEMIRLQFEKDLTLEAQK
ncbi:MAG: hypothetical protein PHW72_01230 [Candidatus Pacebacteria bacterium]|nr:hypothetical protein [Candidatus Paceibacterota bacterium]